MLNILPYRYFAVFIFIIIVFYSAFNVIQSCDGNYIYPLDDTYIHLAISNNLSNHGIWGVTQHEFSSSSSSILYTLILSLLILIFGNNSFVPLIINVLASYFIIYILFNILKPEIFISYGDKSRSIKSGILILLAVLAIVFFSPLVILTLSGMEHSLQILFNLLFIKIFIEFVEDRSPNKLRNLLISSLAVTSIRYEGIFLIFIVVMIMLINKNYKSGLLLFVVSAVPLVIYGIISYSNGWMVVPNSILMKSSKPETYNLIGILYYPFRWISRLLSEPHLMTIFVTSAAILWVNIKTRSSILVPKNIWLLITLSLVIMHLTFAKTGWVFRYEAYIVSIGLLGIIFNFVDIIKFGDSQLKRISVIMLAVVLIVSSARMYDSFADAKTMSVNIYQQQYQMAKFLKSNYNNSTIILGDIGAATYFTNIKLIDLVALGSIETLKMKMSRTFNSIQINKLANSKDAEIAILYKDAFAEYIPNNWIEIESWKIKNNKGCFKDEVTFYALDQLKALRLKANLEYFAEQLHPDVERIIP